jgi:hypothetical protein
MFGYNYQSTLTNSILKLDVSNPMVLSLKGTAPAQQMQSSSSSINVAVIAGDVGGTVSVSGATESNQINFKHINSI